MLNKQDNSCNKFEYVFLMTMGFLLGILCFVCVYGVKILNFTYDAWLFNWDIDLKQHYVGWCHFRNASWQFPIGMIDTLSVPYSMSVVYTDSIPLFAVIFKIFRNYLPVHFQYYGLFGLLSFALQGALSTVLVRRFTKNKFFCIVSSLIFVLSFSILHRMYYHTALASQWIIILALIIWFYRDADESTLKSCIKWGGMAFLCVVIHSYFVAMTGMILLIDRIEKILIEIKQAKKAAMSGTNEKTHVNRADIIAMTVKEIAPIAVFCIITILTLFLLGGFSGAGSVSGGGIGVFGANINTYVNPDNMGCILKKLPYSTTFQYEGFGYLGAGILLIYIFIIVRAVTGYVKSNLLVNEMGEKHRVSSIDKIKKCIKELSLKRKLLIILVGLSFVSAVFPFFSINDIHLFTIPLPKSLNSIFGIFRSNGRFIWVSMYVLMLVTIVYVARHMNERTVIVLFIMAIVIQIYDMSHFVKTRQNYFNVRQEFNNPFETLEQYDMYKGKKSFVMLYNEVGLMMEAGMYGYMHDMDLNCFYYARPINEEMDACIQGFKDELKKGLVRDDCVYIIKSDELYSGEYENVLDTNLKCHDIYEYVIFTK